MLSRSSIGLTLFFLLHLCTSAAAQDYQEKIFTIKDGLPANKITALLQDHRGFIWLGTDNGLARFDGYSFKVFHHDSKDSNSISNGRITTIIAYRENNIWVGTFYGGLNCYNTSSQKFTHYALPVSKINHIPYQQVTSLLIDSHRRLWVGAYNGLYYFDATKNQLVEFPLDTFITVKNFYNWVLHLQSDEKFLYVMTNHGFAVIDLQTMKDYYTGKNPLRLSFFSGGRPIDFSNADFEGAWYWRQNLFTKKMEWCHYDGVQNRTTVLLANADSIYQSSYNFHWLDAQHILCYSPYHSMMLLDPTTGKVKNFQLSELKRADGVWITHNENGSKNIWGGTQTGLNLFSQRATPFHVLNAKQFIKSALPFNGIVVLFHSSDNQLWICSTGNGIAVMDSSLHQNNLFYKAIFADRFYNHFWSVYEDQYRKIWIGRQCGFSIYNPRDHSMKDFFFERHDNTGNDFYVASSFLQTNDTTIWIGSNKGLAKADARSGNVRKWFVYDPAKPNIFPLNRVNKLIRDNLNHYWIMSDDGLFTFDPLTEQFKTLDQTIGSSIRFSSRGLSDVNTVNHQLLIASSSGFGILNLDSKQLRVYSYSDGLPAENILYVTPENDSTCWLTTSSGLSRFDIVHSTFTNFNYKDGLPSFENELSNLLRLPDGDFIMAADSMLIRFNPANVKVSSQTPPVAITEFYADNKSYSVPKDSSQAIQLDWKNRVINVSFSTLQFSDADFAQYQYRLEGVDASWNNAFSKNQINYSNLAAGNYYLQVRASYGNGEWGNPVLLNFEIATPFWKSWWFVILVGVVLLSIPVLILWNIISNQRAKILQHQRINSERQRISAELHDDVGSTLTKIALLGHAYESDPEKNKNLLGRMTSSADSMVDHMNEIIWALNVRNDTLQNLLAYLRKYASEFLEGKFELQIEQPDQIPEKELSGEARRNIFLVVKEALHNVMKHSNAHCVKLIFSINHELKISIADDGIGISEEKKNEFGNGLMNMRQRMEQIGGEFKIESLNGSGTQVTINFPLK